MRRRMHSAPCQPSTESFVAVSFAVCVDLPDTLSMFLTFWFCASVSRLLFFFYALFHRDLSNNQISELASDAFQGLRSLNSLWVLCGMFIFKMCFIKKIHCFEGIKKFQICLSLCESCYLFITSLFLFLFFFLLLAIVCIFYVNNVLTTLISEIYYGHNTLRKKNRKHKQSGFPTTVQPNYRNDLSSTVKVCLHFVMFTSTFRSNNWL